MMSKTVLDVVIGVLVVSETLSQTLLDKRISLRRDRVRSKEVPAEQGILLVEAPFFANVQIRGAACALEEQLGQFRVRQLHAGWAVVTDAGNWSVRVSGNDNRCHVHRVQTIDTDLDVDDILGGEARNGG